MKFRPASNCCKRVLEAAKLAYATKTKESITSEKLDSHGFWRIANSVLNKGKSAIQASKFGGSDHFVTVSLLQTSNAGNNFSLLPIFLFKKAILEKCFIEISVLIKVS